MPAPCGAVGVIGPLEQSDMVGLDLTKSIHDVLIKDLDRTPHTQPYLAKLVEEGNLGMKTGRALIRRPEHLRVGLILADKRP